MYSYKQYKKNKICLLQTKTTARDLTLQSRAVGYKVLVPAYTIKAVSVVSEKKA